jgi:hypothetical protein
MMSDRDALVNVFMLIGIELGAGCTKGDAYRFVDAINTAAPPILDLTFWERVLASLQGR